MLRKFFLMVIFSAGFSLGSTGISIIEQRLYDDSFSRGSLRGIEQFLEQLNEQGSFDDLGYEFATNQGARDLRTHSNRLHTMAFGYRYEDENNQYYNSPQLLEKINIGWHWLAFEAPENRSPNWWFSKIGLPRTFWEGLILVKEYIPQDVINEVFYKYSVRTNAWMPEEAKDNNAGANLTDRAVVAVTEGVLRGNLRLLEEVREMIEREVCDFDGHHRAGIRPDMSFHQHPIVVGRGNPIHRVQYYPGGYGTAFASQVSNLAVWLRGTEYEFSEKAIDRIISYFLDGQQWVMRGLTFAPSSIGRGISRRGSVLNSCGEQMIEAVEQILIFEKRTDELNAYLSRMRDGDFDDDISGNKMFWQSDVMIHRRPNYMVSVRKISERTIRPESTAENKKGFYLGDGFTTIMLDGTEYGERVGREIFPCWDWELLPGTTVNHTGTVPYASVSVPFPSETVPTSVGDSDFVGGVSNGTYGAAVMDYKRQGVDVTAKKSWFFFDDYFVALGADIKTTANSDGNVRTALNQIVLSGDVIFSKGGALGKLQKENSLKNTNIDWVHHRDTGYIVDANEAVTLSAKTQAGDWSDIGGNTGQAATEVFTLFAEHGNNPADASYEYAVVPDISVSRLRGFYSNPPYEILENSGLRQAVFDSRSKVLQVIFYSPGTFSISEDVEITADSPAVVMMYMDNGKLNIWAAEPTKKLTQCEIDIKINTSFFSDNQENQTINKKVVISFGQDEYAGKSVLKVVD